MTNEMAKKSTATLVTLSQKIAAARGLDPLKSPDLVALIEIEIYLKGLKRAGLALRDNDPLDQATKLAYCLYDLTYLKGTISTGLLARVFNFVLYQVTTGGRLSFNRRSFKDYENVASEALNSLETKAKLELLENPESARAQADAFKVYTWACGAIKFAFKGEDLYKVATDLKESIEANPGCVIASDEDVISEFLSYFDKKRVPSEEQAIIKTFEAIGYGPELRAEMAWGPIRCANAEHSEESAAYFKYLRSTKEYKAIKKVMAAEGPATARAALTLPVLKDVVTNPTTGEVLKEWTNPGAATAPEPAPLVTIKPEAKTKPVAKRVKPSWRDSYFSEEDLTAMGPALSLFLEQKTAQLRKPQRRLLNRLLCFLGERVSLSQETEARARLAKHMEIKAPETRIFSADGVVIAVNTQTHQQGA